MATRYSTRTATPNDLDGILDVVLAAMPHDAQWDYRFVHKHEFPDDHRNFTRLLYEQFIAPANDDWHVMLAEASVPGTAGAGNIVAFSVWDMSFANKAKKGPEYEPQNRKSCYPSPGMFELTDH